MSPNETTTLTNRRTIVIVARHGERLDYYLRDKPKSNFVTTAERPWDPPLTERGRLQGRALGNHLATLIPELGLESLSGVYSSPLIRCCQTASEAIVGYNHGSSNPINDLKVHVEPGVVESMTENWFKSWCLEGSNGSWGGPPNVTNPNELKRNERANQPAHTLLRTGQEVHSYFSTQPETDERDDSIQYCYNPNRLVPHKDLASILAPSNDSIFQYPSNQERISDTTSPEGPICDFGYHWGNFESGLDQQDRMHHVIESLAERHEGETILVVSHGGPVTHLFERLMQAGWEEHGLATYACFSVYEKVTKGEQTEEQKEGGSWQSLVVNESCHVQAMKLASETQSSNKVDFFE